MQDPNDQFGLYLAQICVPCRPHRHPPRVRQNAIMGDTRLGRGLHALVAPPPWLGQDATCLVPSLAILEKQSAALASPLAFARSLGISFAISALEHSCWSCGRLPSSMATSTAWSHPVSCDRDGEASVCPPCPPPLPPLPLRASHLALPTPERAPPWTVPTEVHHPHSSPPYLLVMSHVWHRLLHVALHLIRPFAGCLGRGSALPPPSPYSHLPAHVARSC